MDYNSQRRRTGLIIGLVLGSGYALTVNLINRLALPGIPLYSPPPGSFGLTVITALMFGLLGLLAALTDESLPGVLLSGLAGSVVSSIWILVNETNKIAAFTLLAVVFLPRMFFYMPFGGLVRWLIHKIYQPTSRPVAPVRKLIPVFAAFIVMILIGSFAMLPKETRTSLVKMDALLQTGMQVTSKAELPKSLQTVQGFMQKANGEYSYIIGSNPDDLPVQRPVAEYGAVEPFIITTFKNGFRFGCVFSPPYIQPACIDF
ncbi:MAG: hypothetical protein ABI904_07695 [Chloroflexota bacterium]